MYSRKSIVCVRSGEKNLRLSIVYCMFVVKERVLATDKQYKLCVPPCPLFILRDDKHGLCVKCLRAENISRGRRLPTHIWLSSQGMGVRRLCPVVQVLRLPRPPVHINHGVHREIWWKSLRWALPFLLLHRQNPEISVCIRKLAWRYLSSPDEDPLSATVLRSWVVAVMPWVPPQSSKVFEEFLEVVTPAVEKLSIEWPDGKTQTKRS